MKTQLKLPQYTSTQSQDSLENVTANFFQHSFYHFP